MMKKKRIMTREEYKKLLDSGRRITNAHLYEKDHCKDGSEFVHVELYHGMVYYKRIWPKKNCK